MHSTILALAAVIALYPATVNFFKFFVWVRDNHPTFKVPVGLGFLPFDIAFNWVYGTWFFQEFPHEFLFSTRVKRHYRMEPTSEVAEYWAAYINKIDPGHITKAKG